MTTGIEWTDETWNPVVGCTQVSPGCAHCYAKQIHDLRHRAFLEGKQIAVQYAVPFETVQLKPERLVAPLSWRAPKRVFVNSVADLFHDDVPAEFIAAVWATMALAPRHTFQILTKRPARMLAVLSDPGFYQAVLDAAAPLRARRQQLAMIGISNPACFPLLNVWLGVSVENQRFADERIPLLLQTPAAVRFLSCEPLLGPVDLSSWALPSEVDAILPPIDWVIVGGESGRDARPCDIHHLTDIVAQCEFAGVACFVKQMGSRPVAPDLTHWNCAYTLLPDASGHALKLRDRHGGNPEEWPAELRVREFPTCEVRA